MARRTNAAKKDSVPIIDTHQHLWDLTKFKPPWLKGAPKVLAKSYVTKDFVEATKGLNVVKAVYMEVDVAPKDQVREAKHVIALSKSDKHPTVGAVISGRPNSTRFKKYIDQFKDNKLVKGVRQVLHVDTAKKGLCLEKQFIKSVRLLGEYGKSFDMCMRPTELKDAAKLADACPDTRLILDHCGNADPKAFMKSSDEKPWHTPGQWKKDMAALAKRKNVICKISGIVARAPKGWKADHLAPIINHCIECFGFHRVIFGGDWPVCLLGASYKQWVVALKDVLKGNSEADIKRLFHDNTVRYYSLG